MAKDRGYQLEMTKNKVINFFYFLTPLVLRKRRSFVK